MGSGGEVKEVTQGTATHAHENVITNSLLMTHTCRYTQSQDSRAHPTPTDRTCVPCRGLRAWPKDQRLEEDYSGRQREGTNIGWPCNGKGIEWKGTHMFGLPGTLQQNFFVLSWLT